MHPLPSRYIPCDGRLTASAYFNHAPRMGSDNRPPYYALYYIIFQSTLPAWGATTNDVFEYELSLDFNPRSPWGERHEVPPGSPEGAGISIHAPRRGSDHQRQRIHRYFSPISIHAPRMGSDSTAKAYSNDRIKWSTLREPHFFYSKNACFSPIVSMCATTSRTKKSENQSFIRIISRLGPYVFHLRLVSIPQIIEPYAVRLLVHQHFQCGTK